MELFAQLLTQKSLIFDLTLVVIILIFAILGARKGLILSLCSLVAVILALIGGNLVADTLAPPLAAQAAPMLNGFLQEHLSEFLAAGTEALENADGFLPHIAQTVLQNQDWAMEAGTILPEFTLAVAEAVMRPVIFLIAFILILIIWKFISHALDLVARLPVLNTLNTAGGFLLGAVKGALLLIVIYLLIQTFRPDLIPADIGNNSRILGVLQKAPALF